MKKFYNSNTTLLRALTATVAFKGFYGRIQKQTTLLVLSMLLLSFNSFGQVTSVRSGSWSDATTWSTGQIPTLNDDVKIMNRHIVVVEGSNEFSCRDLTIVAGTGNPKTGGQLVVGDTLNMNATAVSKLNLANLKFETANGKPKERATLKMGYNAYLTISGAIFKINSSNGNLVSTTDHTDIFYRFRSTSVIEYRGAAQTLFNFYSISGELESDNSTPYGNLILSGSGTKTPAARTDGTTGLVVRGTLTVNPGVSFDARALAHTVSGNLSNAGTIEAKTSRINVGGSFTNTGSFLKGTGLVNYNGGNQNAAGVDYHNLQFSGSGTKTATGGLSVGSNLDIVSDITFNAASGTHTIAANLSNAGTINAGSSTIKIGGSFTNTANAVFNSGTGNIEYNGNNQNISPLYYYNLTLSPASANVTKTAGGAIFLSNAFVINTGAGFAHNSNSFYYNGGQQTITPATYYNLVLGGSGVKSAISNLLIEGNLALESGAKFETSGTSSYIHSIRGGVQNSGIINNVSGTVTSANELSVTGNFTNNGTFNAKGATHTILGDWTNNGTFNSNTSTIVLSGSSSTKKITSLSAGTDVFYNLTVSNGSSSLINNLTVNNTLLVENTILQTGASTLILGSNANYNSVETATAHIKGNLQTTRNLTEGGTELFGRMGMRITNSSSPINNVTVKRVTGTTFENSTVERQYYITTPNAQATDKFTAAMELAFPDFNLTEPAGTLYEVYRKNLNNTYELLPKVATAETFYNYKLADADRKYGVYTLANRITPLPVELTWFKAQRQAQGVLLTWETASEKENKGFEVQVSANGKSFSKVAFVESKGVNSSVAQRYSYTDNSTVASVIRYYRLAQVDLDGTTTYSNIKAVDMDTKVVAAAAFPNPFAEGQEVTVRLPQGGESRQVGLVLTNTMGQVVLEQQAQVQDGQVELTLNMARASAKGLYLLNVIDNGTRYTFKLVKK